MTGILAAVQFQCNTNPRSSTYLGRSRCIESVGQHATRLDGHWGELRFAFQDVSHSVYMGNIGLLVVASHYKATSVRTQWWHNTSVNTLRPRQNGRHFADDIFARIFFNENVWISIKISLKFVLKGPINKIPALVQVMAWRRPGDKPLSEPILISSLTHICVTRPQWVKN